MLVLTRKVNETVEIDGIGGSVTIQVTRIGGSKVRLGITAPPDVSVLRGDAKDRHEIEGDQGN